MLAFEVDTPGQKRKFNKMSLSHRSRRNELERCGQLRKVNNFRTENFLANEGADVKDKVENHLEDFFSDIDNRFKETSLTLNNKDMFLAPLIKYQKDIKPTLTSSDVTGEVVYIYSTLANSWNLPTLSRTASITGTCSFNSSDNKNVTIDEVTHYVLINNKNSHTWQLNTDQSIRSFDLSLYDSSASPFPAVLDSGKPRPFKLIGFSFNQENQNMAINLYKIKNPYVDQLTLLLTAKNNPGQDFITYRMSGDTYTRRFFSQYDFSNFRYLLTMRGVILPTHFDKNDETSIVFLKVVGLNSAAKILINGEMHYFLGIMDLTSETTWLEGTKKDKAFSFKLSDSSSDSSHVCYPLELINVSDISNFTISLLDQNGKDISFTKTTKRPQYRLDLTVHPK